MPFVSVYTPIHKAKRSWILSAYESLVRQSYEAWQWVVVVNGPQYERMRINQILDRINDERIKRIELPVHNCIGYLKGMACYEADGEMLVELDYDDWLTPNCLARLVRVHDESGAGFLFSDSAAFREDWSSETYDAFYGWSTYRAELPCPDDQSREAIICSSFDATPRALCEVFFAPNHVRAWMRDAYWDAGGYDPTLRVCDDHDLCCRTYLAGVDMKLIREPLYCYRRHDGNSSALQNPEVRRHSQMNMNRYLHPLVFEWARRKQLRMIDLGGAHNCPRNLGFEALDQHAGAEHVCDAVEMPFENDSVGVFRAYDFLEHIPPGDKMIRLWNSIYDKLTPGGWLLTATPSVVDPEGRVGLGADRDPTHVSRWNTQSFWYYTRSDQAGYVPELRCRFQEVRNFVHFPSELHEKNRIPYVVADLVALKGQRTPGLSSI